MLPDYKVEASLRLKGAAGHLEGMRRMVEQDACCVDLMEQLAAVHRALERVQAIFLRNHLSRCVSTAIRNGMGDAIIDERTGALKYDTRLIDGRALASNVPDAARLGDSDFSAALGAPYCAPTESVQGA